MCMDGVKNGGVWGSDVGKRLGDRAEVEVLQGLGDVRE